MVFPTEDAKATKASASGKLTFKGQLFDWLDVLVSAVIVVVIVFSLFFRVATIDGESMMDTFYENEKVIMSGFMYKPKSGDVVIISRNIDNSVSENTALPLIKRVIATEFQTVDIDFATGIVYVDGKALDEPYARTPTNVKYDIEFPVTVPAGCVFVLGDNRNLSLDSRSSQIGNNGMISTDYILGRVFLRIYPFNRIQLF